VLDAESVVLVAREEPRQLLRVEVAATEKAPRAGEGSGA
jgi:hypothetical protein